MALSIDNTVAGASSNSYITLAEMATYMEAHIDSAIWASLADDPTRNIYIVHACRIIERIRFRGNKNASTQALKFPMDIQPYVDSQTAVTAIPPNVKNAQAEQALHLAKHGTSKRDDLRGAGVKRFNYGRGGHSEELSDLTQDLEISPVALALLGPYLARSAEIV